MAGAFPGGLGSARADSHQVGAMAGAFPQRPWEARGARGRITEIPVLPDPSWRRNCQAPEAGFRDTANRLGSCWTLDLRCLVTFRNGSRALLLRSIRRMRTFSLSSLGLMQKGSPCQNWGP